MPRNRSSSHQKSPRGLQNLFNDLQSNNQQDVDVGGSLRRLRESKGLTIRSLAEESGLSVNTLSLNRKWKNISQCWNFTAISYCLTSSHHILF